MGVAPPILDERGYKALVDELLRRIPVHSPEWTDFNESDPGITLIELFAFLGDTLLWVSGEQQRQYRRRRARLRALLVVGAAGVGLAVWRGRRAAAPAP